MKEEKTVEQQAKEFLERERRVYDKRMKQAENDRENAVESKEMFPEETSEDAAVETETEIETEENNQGE